MSEDYPEHDRTSCSDEDLNNIGFNENGNAYCRRCSHLYHKKAAADRAFIEAIKPHLVVHESGAVELHMLIVRNENCVRMEGDAAVAHIAGGVWVGVDIGCPTD